MYRAYSCHASFSPSARSRSNISGLRKKFNKVIGSAAGSLDISGDMNAVRAATDFDRREAGKKVSAIQYTFRIVVVITCGGGLMLRPAMFLPCPQTGSGVPRWGSGAPQRCVERTSGNMVSALSSMQVTLQINLYSLSDVLAMVTYERKVWRIDVCVLSIVKIRQ